MTNVDNDSPDEISKNPLGEYKVDFDIVRSYIMENDFIYYKKKSKEPIRKNFKTKAFGEKDSGKTHFAHTVALLDVRNPEIDGGQAIDLEFE